MALIDDILKFVQAELVKELKAQGHDNTHSLITNIDRVSRKIADDVVGELYMNDYWEPLNTGVRKNKIPYRRGSGKKESKYINGLINYFQSKGLVLNEAKNAAFATANVQKKEGMPTSKSYKFSNNNKRTGFMDVIDKEQGYIEEYIELSYQKEVQTALDNLIDRLNAA